MEALMRNEDPMKWWNLHVFTVGLTKRCNYGKVAKGCGEAEGKYEFLSQGLLTKMSFSLSFLPLIKMCLSFWSRKDIFHMSISSLAFKKKKKSQSVFLACAIFQMPLTQNNPCAEVAWFRAVHSAALRALRTFTLSCSQPPDPCHCAALKRYTQETPFRSPGSPSLRQSPS